MNQKKQNTMRKNAMKIIYTSAILIIVIIGMSIMSSCERPKHHQVTTEVDEDTKEELIKVECLHRGTLKDGVYKVTIDYTTYVVVTDNDGVAIIKHNVRPR